MSPPLASRYEIRRKLGEGGMADVYEAIAQGEAGFTRRVAIKRLRPGHESDPSFARMFLDEARIASKLHHGGIVGVLDYGIVDGTPFQILEFVDGESARALSSRGNRLDRPMPLEVALHVVTEIARSLHYAHTSEDETGSPQGVVHRDVKPSNILVSRAGDVKLADFGIARATERSERTKTGVAKGTPGFMAPEQVLGGAIDARTDIFALGCTLHALAFGQSPLGLEGNVERMLKGAALALHPDIPEDVAAVIARAVEPLPSRRYATAAAMAEEVGVALAGRLRGDAKGALIKWLESITEPAPSGATLDALLMPEALLEQGEAGSWHFEPTRHESPVAQTPEREPSVPAPLAPPAPSRRRWIAGAAALGLVVLGAGLVAFLRPARSEPAPLAPPGSKPSAVATSASGSTLIATPPATMSDTPAPTSPPAPVDGARVERRASAPHPSAAPPAAPPAPPSHLLGTLAVRGGVYRGATIAIDGRTEPFGAPHYFDLPVGEHTVALRVDGGVIAQGRVSVLPDHTPTRPLYWP